MDTELAAPPQTSYTTQTFAKELIELCRRENFTDIILIGLNYGANVGIVMNELAPGLITHLILIEPPIFMEPWIVKVVEQQIEDLKNPSETLSQNIVDAVMPNGSPQDRTIALLSMKNTPTNVKSSTYANLLEWDKHHNFQCQVPTLLIQTTQVFCKEEALKSHFTNLQVGRVVGSGPWANLEVPAQVHSMIDRFLELSKI